jgi:hypothetical protein
MSFWRAKIGGETKEWESENTEQVPDQSIAWQNIDGSPNSGSVTFEDLGSGRTRVTASIEYEPEGFVEKAGDALGIPSRRVEGDLKRFRDFIEERGRETGGWRGQIEGSEADFRPRAAGAVLGTADEPLEAESGLERPARSALGGERYAMTEEPVVEKEVHVTGGVRVRKTESVEQETVQEVFVVKMWRSTRVGK